MGELYSFDADQHSGQPSGCWRSRTTLEKCFIVFNTIIIIGLTILGSFAYLLFAYPPIAENPRAAAFTASPHDILATGNHDTATNSSPMHCDSAGCVHAASQILSYLDNSASPCDNFYQFACGSYLLNTEIPEDQSAVNIFSEIGDQLLPKIRDLLAEPPQSGVSPTLRMPNDLYAACMDQQRIEARGLAPVLKLADRVGGWPVLGTGRWERDEQWSWVEILKEMGRAGVQTGYIFYTSVQTDLLNSSMRTLDLDQTVLGLSREYLVEGLNDTTVQAYLKYMVDVAVALGANQTFAESEMQTTLEFEIELALIGLPDEERRNATALHNPMKLDAIQAAYPFIQWDDYINTLLPKNIRVDANETIIVTVPTFYANLTRLLERTPNRTIVNYLVWRTIEQTTKYAPDVLRNLLHAFEFAQYGVEERQARWRECTDETLGSLPISLAALYVRHNFNFVAKEAAVEMTTQIRSEFGSILRSVQWMDEETREAALVKLHAMVAHIGYPDELDDEHKLAEYYGDLTVVADEYLESVLNVNRFDQQYEFGQLRLPVNKTDWVTHSTVASLDARYRPTENSIAFPAGILQGRFFSVDRPAYLNYGAIGFVIGHEITHGFDDKGRQFDQFGNVKSWWHPATLEQFIGKTECIIEQFSNYTEATSNLTLNGIRTQGENIADSGGMRIAYNAYANWQLRNGQERALPALPYSAQQLFWIAAAQSWCSVAKEETIKRQVLTDQHSPDVFRVLGAMQNSAEFARDFECASGTPMNPAVKCGLW